MEQIVLDIILISRKLLSKLKINIRISSIDELTSPILYLEMYKKLFPDNIADILRIQDLQINNAGKLQLAIDFFFKKIAHINNSSKTINGQDIVNNNLYAILQFWQLLELTGKYFPSMQKEKQGSKINIHYFDMGDIIVNQIRRVKKSFKQIKTVPKEEGLDEQILNQLKMKQEHSQLLIKQLNSEINKDKYLLTDTKPSSLIMRGPGQQNKNMLTNQEINILDKVATLHFEVKKLSDASDHHLQSYKKQVQDYFSREIEKELNNKQANEYVGPKTAKEKKKDQQKKMQSKKAQIVKKKQLEKEIKVIDKVHISYKNEIQNLYQKIADIKFAQSEAQNQQVYLKESQSQKIKTLKEKMKSYYQLQSQLMDDKLNENLDNQAIIQIYKN